MFNKKIVPLEKMIRRGPINDGSLSWPPLLSGTLVKRYKRFLAEIELDSGETVVAHCPNSGSMKTCCEPGRPVYVSHDDSPKRKLHYTWQLIRMEDSLVGVNTLVPNRLVWAAIAAGAVSGFPRDYAISREVTVAPGSRLDLLLSGPAGDRCYIEIKNCTLVENRVARFPDAVTQRGAKHLETLQDLVARGHRCVMFYLVQRTDAAKFAVAGDIDPVYETKFFQAVRSGVEIMAYDVNIDLTGIRLNRKLEIYT